MQFFNTINMAAALFALTSQAAPMNEAEKAELIQREVDALFGYGYATFYTDTGCTQNPTQAFSMSNPGCIAHQDEKHSIYVQPGLFGGPRLVFSPGEECDCQNECKGIYDFDGGPGTNGGDNFCIDLSGNVGAHSFRFVSDRCGDNQC